jgi:drug/metabolite transporter (DMT)-like permease
MAVRRPEGDRRMRVARALDSTPALAFAFVLLWNSGFIGAEYALPYSGPLTLLLWRYLPLGLLLGALLLARRRLFWPGARVAAHTAIVGVLAHGVWLGCVMVALERDVPAGIVALVVALQPMTTGLLSRAVTGERTTRLESAGLVLGFAGVALAVGARIDWADTDTTVAYLIPLGSVAAITIASLLQRRRQLYTAADLPLDLALFYQSAATAAAVAIPALLVEGWSVQPAPEFLATMAWLILGVSFAAYALMWGLLARMDAPGVASLFYLGPPVTMLMAWVAFGDTLRSTALAGLLVAGVGVALVQSGGHLR